MNLQKKKNQMKIQVKKNQSHMKIDGMNIVHLFVKNIK